MEARLPVGLAAGLVARVAAGRVALVVAHDQRAEVAGAPLPRRPAADHELLFGPDLELEPGSGPLAGFVAGSPVLGDGPLEPLSGARLEERDTLGLDMTREAHPRVLTNH